MKKFNEIREENEKAANKLQEETKDQKWAIPLCGSPTTSRPTRTGDWRLKGPKVSLKQVQSWAKHLTVGSRANLNKPKEEGSVRWLKDAWRH